MSDLLIGIAFAAYALVLVPGQHRKYAAIAGWACIVLNLFSELPAFVAEANFLYPTLALLSVPFIAIMVKELLSENPVALRFSMTAAVTSVLFVPFAVIPVLRDTLISVVISAVFYLVTALGHQPIMFAWDVIAENGFYNQIITGCTGILAIAIVMGILAGIADRSRERLFLAIILVPVIFILNIFRVAGVFIAVSDRWFSGFPDPTGTGDANFFWAHNVVAEALAILFLLLLLAVLVRALPGLWDYVRDVGNMYIGGIRKFGRRKP